jgi:hypothetical protein
VSESLKKNLIKYGVSVVASLALAFFFVYARVDFSNPGATELIEWYRIICDAFTIPGLLFLMFGCLMSLSNAGAMDGLGYVVVNGLKMLIPGGALKMERYKEYLERRRENRVRGYGFLYIVGIGCMAVAFVFMILFYGIYNG